MKISDKIRRERRRKGWTQEELARRAGATKVSVSRWERGDVVPRFDQLKRIATAFEMPVSGLADIGVPEKLLKVQAKVTRLFHNTEQGRTRDWENFESLVRTLLERAAEEPNGDDSKERQQKQAV